MGNSYPLRSSRTKKSNFFILSRSRSRSSFIQSDQPVQRIQRNSHLQLGSTLLKSLDTQRRDKHFPLKMPTAQSFSLIEEDENHQQEHGPEEVRLADFRFVDQNDRGRLRLYQGLQST